VAPIVGASGAVDEKLAVTTSGVAVTVIVLDAAAKATEPAWVPVTTHAPTAFKVTVVPLIEQTFGVEVVSVTASDEVDDAVTVTVVFTVFVVVLGVRVTVCGLIDTAKD
jgi:hypothetical protein